MPSWAIAAWEGIVVVPPMGVYSFLFPMSSRTGGSIDGRPGPVFLLFHFQ